jgi:hypothetical protein
MIPQDRFEPIAYAARTLVETAIRRGMPYYALKIQGYSENRSPLELRGCNCWVGVDNLGAWYSFDETIILFRTFFDELRRFLVIQSANPAAEIGIDVTIDGNLTDEIILQTFPEILSNLDRGS